MFSTRLLLAGCALWSVLTVQGILGAEAGGSTPDAPGQLEYRAGDLGLVLHIRTNGIQLQALTDRGQGQELLASNGPPIFAVTLHHIESKKEGRLAADAGWRRVSSRQLDGNLSLRWDEPEDESFRGLSVTASAAADALHHAFTWNLQVENKNTNWSVWRVRFPQLALRDLGETAGVLFPRGPGEVQHGVWSRSFKYSGNYPGGWCSMQFMAVYQEQEKPTGLYVAVHDPWGSTKDLALETDPALHRLRMAFDHPAPNMGQGGNSFELSGQAVWRLLRGDWFDAAQIYKQWAKKEARWWPQTAVDGRSDTPLWMRQLNLWVQGGGAPSECVTAVKEFRNYLVDGPERVGFHWYSWHQIPFDNDYPHYFPAKTDFRQGVAELQDSKVQVMPYINGRLWDTHDRGAEDFEFTRVALPAACKQENRQPSVESYGSKETNGEPVRLAVMCPSTALWQAKIHDTVLKLLSEVGTKAVYIDQIAAAPPVLCLDPSHGHPLGGGHWWNEGYWQMLDRIRRDMPPGAILTSECNGEPFVRWLDGYLTWHWQFDGQVPAFPAVYGGAIQMFGRAYRGGPTKDLALRMKAGQQLVFGEQIGWMDPSVIHEPSNAEFLKRIVAVRHRFADYFYAGEMCRPPKLLGTVPKVKADWQWSGEWWVTTDAVLTGAWRLANPNRVVALFVNVSGQPVRFTPLLDKTAAPPSSPAQCYACKLGDGAVVQPMPSSAFGQDISMAPQEIRMVEW